MRIQALLGQIGVRQLAREVSRHVQYVACFKHGCPFLCRIPLSLSWGGKTISVEVYWFQYESDPARNSNVYQVANKAVEDHFPGEFGSERLVQQAVAHILRVTENKEGMEQVSGHHPSQGPDHTPNERPAHIPNEGAPIQSPPLQSPSSGQFQSAFYWCFLRV